MAICTLAIANITEAESKALFRYKAPLAVSDLAICEAGLHKVCY
jgi:hypothetical protein